MTHIPHVSPEGQNTEPAVYDFPVMPYAPQAVIQNSEIPMLPPGPGFHHHISSGECIQKSNNSDQQNVYIDVNTSHAAPPAKFRHECCYIPVAEPHEVVAFYVFAVLNFFPGIGWFLLSCYRANYCYFAEGLFMLVPCVGWILAIVKGLALIVITAREQQRHRRNQST